MDCLEPNINDSITFENVIKLLEELKLKRATLLQKDETIKVLLQENLSLTEKVNFISDRQQQLSKELFNLQKANFALVNEKSHKKQSDTIHHNDEELVVLKNELNRLQMSVLQLESKLTEEKEKSKLYHISEQSINNIVKELYQQIDQFKIVEKMQKNGFMCMKKAFARFCKLLVSLQTLSSHSKCQIQKQSDELQVVTNELLLMKQQNSFLKNDLETAENCIEELTNDIDKQKKEVSFLTQHEKSMVREHQCSIEKLQTKLTTTSDQLLKQSQVIIEMQQKLPSTFTSSTVETHTQTYFSPLSLVDLCEISLLQIQLR